jgi:hypothetical protein
MQPGHEEVALAPEELSLAPELEELLLDESSFFEHEMMVRLKRDMRIICKILFISFYSTVMRGNKFEK